METINNKVPTNILRRAIANTTFPNWDSLNYTDESSCKPASEKQAQEGTGLDVLDKLVSGVVDGVKIVVNALVVILYVIEFHINIHIVVGFVCEYSRRGYSVVLIIYQMQARSYIISPHLNYPHCAEQKRPEKHKNVDGHYYDYF